MKTLVFSMLTLLSSLGLYAQPRIVFSDGTNAQTMTKTALRTQGIEVDMDVEVKNISSRDVRIRLEEFERTLSDTSFGVQVCLKAFNGDGACIPTPVGYVSELKSIEPNKILEQFKVILVHKQKAGTGQVKYRIVSEDLSDTLLLTANFTVENPVSVIPRSSSPVYGFNSVGPNPATDVLKLDYAIPAGVKNAAVEVYDLMGRLAHKLSVPAGENQFELSVRGLNPGMYFLNLTADGKTLAVKRFSVKR